MMYLFKLIKQLDLNKIRHDIEEDFKNIIGNRVEELCTAAEVEVAYAFQAMDEIPEGAVTYEVELEPMPEGGPGGPPPGGAGAPPPPPAG